MARVTVLNRVVREGPPSGEGDILTQAEGSQQVGKAWQQQGHRISGEKKCTKARGVLQSRSKQVWSYVGERSKRGNVRTLLESVLGRQRRAGGSHF